jgi:sulfur carrier protein
MICVNGRTTDMPAGATIATILDRLDLAGEARGVAVAVDAEVVPRSQWDTFTVPDGARVEVLTAVQGG